MNPNESSRPKGMATKRHEIAEAWAAKFPVVAPNVGLISSAAHFAEDFMSQSHFDASHNFNHIKRVVTLAGQILETIQSAEPKEHGYDASLVVLGALLHDIGDRKYSIDSDAEDLVYQTLRDLDSDHDIAHQVQTLVYCVSYSFESKNPVVVQNTLGLMPELGIVQDADRLDAIGAVGIGRCFTFGGARRRTMEDTVEHFSEKLVKLEDMIKTLVGRKIAQERTRRLNVFLDWWHEEASSIENKVTEPGPGSSL